MPRKERACIAVHDSQPPRTQSQVPDSWYYGTLGRGHLQSEGNLSSQSKQRHAIPLLAKPTKLGLTAILFHPDLPSFSPTWLSDTKAHSLFGWTVGVAAPISNMSFTSQPIQIAPRQPQFLEQPRTQCSSPYGPASRDHPLHRDSAVR